MSGARVVFNDALCARQDAYAAGVRLSDTDVQKQMVTAAKKTPQRAGLSEVASVVLVQVCPDARRAYRNWFDSMSGNRKGRKVGPPRFKSRKNKGSNNRAKARVRVAKAHAKMADARKAWAHKQSTAIIRENHAVFTEDLRVTGLARTRLVKSVHDAGWGMFTRMVEEKTARYGRTFVKVDRFFPSSQLCSACGVVHDRDVNAAKNIHAAGRAEWLNACGGR